MTENRGKFDIKLVMIGLLQSNDFWWVNRLVCYISNSFWIALIRVLWTKLWSTRFENTQTQEGRWIVLVNFRNLWEQA